MKALCLGGAAEVWDDVEATERLFGKNWWDIVVAANDVACHWPHPLDAWCTLHSEKMAGWRKAREANGHPPATEHISRRGKEAQSIDRTIRHPYDNGSSGLLAVAVAQDLKAQRIVLCGIPMTKSPYFSESDVHPEGKNFAGAEAHWKKWLEHGDKLDGIVKSMSGRTRKLLGAPTRAWLEEIDGEQAA